MKWEYNTDGIYYMETEGIAVSVCRKPQYTPQVMWEVDAKQICDDHNNSEKMKRALKLVGDVQCNFPSWWYDEKYNKVIEDAIE